MPRAAENAIGASHSSTASAGLVASMLAGRRVDLRAIAPALTARDWSFEKKSNFTSAVLVTSGRGSLVATGEVLDFSAPTLLWAPSGIGEKLHLKAGGAGYLLTISNDFLAGAIGSSAESIALAASAERMLVASVPPGQRMEDLQNAFSAIGRELARSEQGSWTSVSANVTLILVNLWRASGIEDVASQSRGTASAILQQFRYLVELHFRDHWAIPRYADSLAVSVDRLHRISIRKLNRSPLKLVHERIMHEAMLLLERSMLTVEQISTRLGFKDPSHFNRFFKSNAGVAPGVFRRDAERSAANRSSQQAHYSYADWP